MKLTDLIVSPKSLGDKLWLVDVSPAYEYKDNKRTDTVLGYRYSVALPEKGLDKVDVRIDGQQQAEAPNGYVEVRFDGLEVFIYKIVVCQQHTAELLKPLGRQLDNLIHGASFAFIFGLLSPEFCLNDHVISPIFMWLLWLPFITSSML